MEDRPVRNTRKDPDGDILALCNPGSYWSPRGKVDAINDIETGRHRYHVPWVSGRTEIGVVMAPRKIFKDRPRRHIKKQP
jgi:hypothetical protein